MSCNQRQYFLPVVFLAILLFIMVFLAGCQTVAATGETHLSLISINEEIRIGREADTQIAATMGVYADQEMQNYFEELGLKMASVCERPELPWSFRVLDDDVINAFAVPGGFIYVTRGILAYCNSEAELAGIVTEMSEAADHTAFREIDYRFHAKIYEYAGNSLLRDFGEVILRLFRESTQPLRGWSPERLTGFVEIHEGIVTALSHRSADDLVRAINVHYGGQDLQQILRHLEEIAASQDDE